MQEKKANLLQLEKRGKDSDYIKELSEIAFLQLELNQFDESERNFNICLIHFQNLKDRLGKSAVLGVLGTLYYKKGEFLKSIDTFREAFIIYKELNQFEEQITCLMGIGNAYIKLEQLDEACDIFLDCSAICSETKDIYGLLDCLGNLIFIHETLERWDIVFELYNKTLEAFQELKDSRGIITAYFNLGLLQKKYNDLEDALLYFKQGTNQAIESNYAELILQGRKTIELRKWNTKFRGDFLIHSSKKSDKVAMKKFGFSSLPEGFILGAVRLTEVKRYPNDKSKHLADSDWGSYGFVLENPRRLKNIISMKGSLNFWNFNNSEELDFE